MKIKDARISILIRREKTTVEIHDLKSNTLLARVLLDPEKLCEALSGTIRVECECDTGDLSRIGLTHENKKFSFEITRSTSEEDLLDDCKVALRNAGMSDWVPDNRYGSQDSFFSNDGKPYARTVIRRWV